MGLVFQSAIRKVNNIQQSELTIYHAVPVGDPNYWLTSDELAAILNNRLYGISLAGLAVKTRSKVAKVKVCQALGYPVPRSFKRCQPRFTGQHFDTYVQKANNLQVWNEELDVERRYVLIRTDENDIITQVKVISGNDLATLDTTGTLTQKFQASLVKGVESHELISLFDTQNIMPLLASNNIELQNYSPITPPNLGEILPIIECFNRLSPLVGRSFQDAGIMQDRIRGDLLHALVCQALGYSDFRDNGQFPDLKHQLLEVKLQTSQTIDLGLVCPNSSDNLYIENIAGRQIQHRDVRYAVFCGKIENGYVTITHFYLTTGQDFFNRFEQFGGNVLNEKIQISLPRTFFNNSTYPV